jgi:hypothetical protein
VPIMIGPIYSPRRFGFCHWWLNRSWNMHGLIYSYFYASAKLLEVGGIGPEPG